MAKMKANTKITMIIDRSAPNTIFLDQESLDEGLHYAAAEERAFAEFEDERNEGWLYIALQDELAWPREQIVNAINEVNRNPKWRPRTISGRVSSFAPFLSAA